MCDWINCVWKVRRVVLVCGIFVWLWCNWLNCLLLCIMWYSLLYCCEIDEFVLNIVLFVIDFLEIWFDYWGYVYVMGIDLGLECVIFVVEKFGVICFDVKVLIVVGINGKGLIIIILVVILNV